ncbi:MAG: hypothetical protein ACK5YO_30030, partial [Planctomyces sp.]
SRNPAAREPRGRMTAAAAMRPSRVLRRVMLWDFVMAGDPTLGLRLLWPVMQLRGGNAGVPVALLL